MVGKGSSDTGTRYEKSSSCLLSCFAGSSVSDSGDPVSRTKSGRRKSCSFSWSKFRAKKKTVPVDATAEITADVTSGEIAVEVSARKDFLKKFRKDKSNSKSRTEYNHHQPKPPTNHTHITNGSHNPPIRVLSKCDARTQPALLYRVHDPVQTGNRTNHPGSTEGASPRKPQKKKPGETERLVALAVTLGAMLLGGRACAIVCMSGWFYLLSYMRVTAAATTNSKSTESSSTEIDTSSEEYKKKVVLQGLLERNGRSSLSRWQKT